MSRMRAGAWCVPLWVLCCASVPATALAGAKADVCHTTGNGKYVIIGVSGNAVGTHLAHGDRLPRVFLADADGDGFGDPGAATTACSAPPGYVTTSGDCDDTASAIHPGATETCDTTDQDCDGLVDEGDIGPTWFLDADGDGYGDPSDTVNACAAPAGYAADATDCDDTDEAVHPNASETCSPVDDDCDGVINESDASDAGTWYADFDADGYGDVDSITLACEIPFGHVADATDCDDADGDLYPGNVESCDDRDEDCDGLVDEDTSDAPTWYDDVDGDLFGDLATGVAACAAPVGTVADATDCDDDAVGVNPGASETCNGVDDDCDAVTDEPDAIDASIWYADGDVDTFGDATNWAVACGRPAGYVADATDCDDDDDAVNPDATETCNGLDDDCEGTADGPDAVDALAWYADFDDDGFGDPSEEWMACDPPVGFVEDDTDCDDGDDTAFPGAVDVCGDAIDQDCSGQDEACSSCVLAPGTESVRDADLVAVAQAGRYVQSIITGDLDGDGQIELIVNEGPEVWAAPVSRGATMTSADAVAVIPRPTYNGGIAAGDVDGDGQDDLLLSRSANVPQPSKLSRMDLVLGPISGTFDLAFADATWTGEPNTSSWASVLGDVAIIGDQTGDGVSDIAITDGNSFSFKGAMYVVSGADRGTRSLASAVARRIGSQFDRMGSVAGPLDVNGDGIGDLVGGATSDNGEHGGRVYVEFGPVAGFSTAAASSDSVLTGEVSGDYAGYQATSAGDVNGDGLDDVIVGAYGSDVGGVNAGAAYVIAAPPPGTSSLAGAHARLFGAHAGWRAGSQVEKLGDVDGDGLGDVVVAAYQANACGDRSGAVYLVSGPAGDVSLDDADRIIVGEPGDRLSETLVAADLDGDGHTDLAIGSEVRGVFVLWGPLLPWIGAPDVDGDGFDANVDCDDGDDTVFPGAAELCDGLDSDCDGLDDYTEESGVCGATPGVVDATFIATGVNGGAEELHTLPDMDGDGGDELAIGGNVFSFPFVSAPIASFTHAHDGNDVRAVGDVDGDGLEDLAWSQSNYQGPLAILSGTPAPRLATYGVADAATTFSGIPYNWGSIEGAGDLTGDGEGDLVIGNYEGLYIVPGPIARGPQALPAPALTSTGYAKYASGPIDLDGDGANDLVVSLGGCSIFGCSSAGGTTVAVVWGGDDAILASRSLADIVATGDGRILFSQGGYVSHFTDVENGHDTTGDGIDDVIVMDRTNTQIRILALESGRAGPITQTRIVGFPRGTSNNRAGPVASPIDLNGDATMDLVVTKSETHPTTGDGGVLYAFEALVPGSTVDLTVSRPQVLEVVAPFTISQFGWVLSVGDYDGDGGDDIATADGNGNLYVLYPNR